MNNQKNAKDNSVHLGNDFYCEASEILYIIPMDSSAAKKLKQTAERDGTLLNCAGNRTTNSVLICKSGLVLLSILKPKEINKQK